MRNIKFRGKSFTDLNDDVKQFENDWVYGSLYETNAGLFIIVNDEKNDIANYIPVKSYTVGQFTGLHAEKTKKGLEKEVYEGDIFREEKNDSINYLIVTYIEPLGLFYLIPEFDHDDLKRQNSSDKIFEMFEYLNESKIGDFSLDVGLTKVGNIHDNNITYDENLNTILK